MVAGSKQKAHEQPKIDLFVDDDPIVIEAPY